MKALVFPITASSYGYILINYNAYGDTNLNIQGNMNGEVCLSIAALEN